MQVPTRTAGAGLSTAPWRKPWWMVSAVITVVALLYFYRIGSFPLTDGDSALYGYVAKDMARTRDWLFLSWRGGPLLDKPPLSLWAMAAGYLVWGYNEFAARAWQSALAVATVAVTYAAARLWLGERGALLAAVFMATSAQFFYLHLVPQQDIPLTFFTTLALYLAILARERNRPAYLYGGWASLGLAVLSKGLVSLVVVGAVVGVVVLLEAWVGRRKLGGNVRWWLVHSAVGLLPFLGVAGPWFVLEYLRHGRPFVELFFLPAGNARFFVASWVDVPTGLIYLAYLLAGWIPWSGFIWPALKRAAAGVRSKASLDLWMAGWTAAVFVVFAFLVKEKIFRYILPMWPAIAILMGRWMDETLHNKTGFGKARWGIAMVSWIMAALLVAAPVLVQVGMLPGRQYLAMVLPFIVTLAVSLAAVGAFSMSRRLKGAVVMGTVLAAAAYVLVVNSLAANWAGLNPWVQMRDVVARQLPAGATPILFDQTMDEAGHWFADYYIEPRVQLARSDTQLEQQVRGQGDALVLAPSSQLQSFADTHKGVSVEIVATAPGGWVVARLRIR